MCGIAGIKSKSFRLDLSQEERFKEGVYRSNQRGPDHQGEYIHYNVALFHQRLSIIDLDTRFNQPFISSCKNLITVCYGEA